MYAKYCSLRDAKGVKDADVAKGTGINKSTFADWKSGRSVPKYEKLAKIAAYFGVPVSYFEGSEPSEMPYYLNDDAKEAASGSENAFAMNVPVLIKNEYGSYRFTLEGAHILSGEWEQIAQMYHTDDCMIISVQGVCDNIDCKWLNDRDYIPNVQIQKDIKVTDQEEFSLESFGFTMEDFGMPREAFSLMGGFRDGRYEVFAETAPGQKKRVSLIYFAFKENTSVIVSVPGYDGSVEIELK